MMQVSEYDVIEAWHSVSDVWIVRANKTHGDGRPYEVVRHKDGQLVGDDYMTVVGRFADIESAMSYGEECNDRARASAVLSRILGQGQPDTEDEGL
jgi:hypothetical protein